MKRSSKFGKITSYYVKEGVSNYVQGTGEDEKSKKIKGLGFNRSPISFGVGLHRLGLKSTEITLKSREVLVELDFKITEFDLSGVA